MGPVYFSPMVLCNSDTEPGVRLGPRGPRERQDMLFICLAWSLGHRYLAPSRLSCAVGAGRGRTVSLRVVGPGTFLAGGCASTPRRGATVQTGSWHVVKKRDSGTNPIVTGLESLLCFGFESFW